MTAHDPTDRPSMSPTRPRDPDAPRPRRDHPQRAYNSSGGGVGHFASFTVAPTVELEVHIVSATGVGSDGRSAGGSRWTVSGWQLVERHPAGRRVLAGQRGSFSAMRATLELLRRTIDPEQLAQRLRAAGIPRLADAPEHD